MARSGKTSFVLYHDIRAPVELLTDEQRGKLFLAILDYSELGTAPDFSGDGRLEMAFAFIRNGLDRDAAAWESKREKRAAAGSLGGKQRAANEANASFACNSKQRAANEAVPVPAPAPVLVPAPDLVLEHAPVLVPDLVHEGTGGKPPRAPRFEPPTVQDVREFCDQRGNNVDPEYFHSYYTANGWTQGHGKKIMDWRAAVRTWEKNGVNQRTAKPAEKPGYRAQQHMGELGQFEREAVARMMDGTIDFSGDDP